MPPESPDPEVHVVTGAFSYTGKYVAGRLLAMGKNVRTLTGRPVSESPFAGEIPASPYHFDQPDLLADSLRGARVLYNTYWVRYCHHGATYDQAIRNTEVLFEACKRAGVARIVHVSIANPSEESPLPYYSGKAHLERTLEGSGLSYAIVRPTVIFGDEDILINNIAWIARRFPIFAVPGSGTYGIQPVFVEDMAALMVDAALNGQNLKMDAVGPEAFTFDELVRLIARSVGSRARLVHVPPGMALALSGFIGRLVKDVVLTRDEIQGLMSGLLVSKDPPTGTTRLSGWLASNSARIGRTYANEIKRHFR